ncbi:hypothetical protein NEISICOT_03318 [Neisseria sicca ATCC 29256]|uniref:Uncharacterized protein n=1 Tax=Neisseria sicca ATCC 29256 TaxID=547045 RepID=C6M9U0_NEISI|nr:hypothetical protein NEISICOT_03318 [Neisseria sicca ATCC 29256]
MFSCVFRFSKGRLKPSFRHNGAVSAACVDCFYIGFNLTRTRRETALPN